MKNRFYIIALLIIATLSINAQTHKIAAYVIGGGGGTVQSTTHKAMGTIGQPAIGVYSNASNTAKSGFWYLIPSEVMQQIALISGWNMISTFVEPNNPNMEAVWANIVDKVLIVKNNVGNAYIPSYDINNIGNWSKTEGYLVCMTSAETLKIKGKKIKPSSTPINLNIGWAIVPYLRSTNMSPALSFQTLDDEEALLIAKDRLGNAYIPSYEIDNLVNLVPGQAYKVYVSKNGSQLTYPD